MIPNHSKKLKSLHIIKIIRFYHDFMAKSFTYMSFNTSDQYCNIDINTSIIMKHEHAFITRL